MTRKTHEQYAREVKAIHSKVAVVDHYVTALTPITHACQTCGHTWKSKPNTVLSMKSGCAPCSRKKASAAISMTTAAYKKRLAEANPTIMLKGKLQGVARPTLHKCRSCRNEFMVRPQGVLAGNKVCAECRPPRKNTGGPYKFQSMRIGGKTFRYQGYEGKGIKHLLTLGYKAKDINASLNPKDDVPTIRYVMRDGRKSWHFPDLFLPGEHRLVEVKCVFTLLASEDAYNRMRLKKKAAEAKGYTYHLLLFNRTGSEVIDIPAKWDAIAYAKMCVRLGYCAQ